MKLEEMLALRGLTYDELLKRAEREGLETGLAPITRWPTADSLRLAIIDLVTDREVEARAEAAKPPPRDPGMSTR